MYHFVVRFYAKKKSCIPFIFMILIYTLTIWHYFNNVCREDFDEENEPDGMVLSGWTSAPTEKDDRIKSNGESSSAALEKLDNADEVEITAGREPIESSGLKRKHFEISERPDKEASIAHHPGSSSANQGMPQDIDDNEEDDLVLLDDSPEIGKKKRLK